MSGKKSKMERRQARQALQSSQALASAMSVTHQAAAIVPESILKPQVEAPSSRAAQAPERASAVITASAKDVPPPAPSTAPASGLGGYVALAAYARDLGFHSRTLKRWSQKDLFPKLQRLRGKLMVNRREADEALRLLLKPSKDGPNVRPRPRNNGKFAKAGSDDSRNSGQAASAPQ